MPALRSALDDLFEYGVISNSILIDNILIFDNGSFISPKIKSIIKVDEEEMLRDVVNNLLKAGVLEWE